MMKAPLCQWPTSRAASRSDSRGTRHAAVHAACPRSSYDGAHRLVEIKDGLNNRVVYTLDNMGNRTKEDYADPANALTRTRSRVYKHEVSIVARPIRINFR